MKRRYKVEFGIHPDALNAPEKYTELLGEQVAWFRKITGSFLVQFGTMDF